ncbi:hypothetical protein BDP81DRAFT_125791 [Colletotrichum phormii]|uniref:Uncharacterized protein n=1 Tax=Colletotrichum phormii TaxID=359342 RepID=A0AAI9ZZB6_9PEZI|nr:uncharacterized protein BDP81DRAFT_125791 [Colletotrichum phormii]KAK1640996.1 hypothetical protein BDP81DRAFT_125791 [Colletotrichum phormii]
MKRFISDGPRREHIRDSHDLLLCFISTISISGLHDWIFSSCSFRLFQTFREALNITSCIGSGDDPRPSICFFFFFFFFFFFGIRIILFGYGVGDTMEVQGNNRHWKESREREETGDRKPHRAQQEKSEWYLFGGEYHSDLTYQTNPRKESGGAGQEFWQGRDFDLGGNSICSMGPAKTYKGLLLLMF